MKAKWMIVLAVGVLGLGLTYLQGGALTPAHADEGTAVTAATVTILPALEGNSEASFVGNKKCKKCHIKQFKSWEETKKAKTFELLKPGVAAEAKTKAKLDPAKDYTKDEKCLKCHTTGYGRPGGYAIPDPADANAVKAAAKLEGVGCEDCHGAGENFTKVHEEIKKSKRTYTDEEMYAAGLHKIDEATCLHCHNEESPTYKPFNFAEQKKNHEGAHEFFPLKQRQE